jgi:single-strand DNA-binding protein
MNVVVLHGTLSRPAERRVLPSGDELVAYEVTTRDSEGKADTVPVVWPGAPKSAEWPSGDAVVVAGRVRRRYYRAGGVTQSRTEVVADRVVPAGQRKRAERLLSAALTPVGEWRTG